MRRLRNIRESTFHMTTFSLDSTNRDFPASILAEQDDKHVYRAHHFLYARYHVSFTPFIHLTSLYSAIIL